MRSTEELEERVVRLERELATLRGQGARSVRRRASAFVGNLPLWEIAIGPDLEKDERRGHAKAVLAVGDIATGFVALGGWARGVLAIGGLATGLFSFGGLSVGALAAVGGLAIGSAAFGGGAIGVVAIGGGAVGEYACGGGAAGAHVISAMRSDPEAEAFFREKGLDGVCPPQGRRRMPAEREPR
jgi:hypothetical protein